MLRGIQIQWWYVNIEIRYVDKEFVHYFVCQLHKGIFI